jgi:hypothetical protein
MLFFLLIESGRTTWLAGSLAPLSTDAWVDIVHGRRRPKGTLEVGTAGGERLADLAMFGLMYALSPRMLAVLRSISASGYSTLPILLKHGPTGCVIHGYEGLIVHGRGGPLDPIRSEAVYEEGALMQGVGHYIYEDRWDGSDIFCIEGLGVSVWVTERVAVALCGVRPKLRKVDLIANTEPFPRVPMLRAK